MAYSQQTGGALGVVVLVEAIAKAEAGVLNAYRTGSYVIVRHHESSVSARQSTSVQRSVVQYVVADTRRLMAVPSAARLPRETRLQVRRPGSPLVLVQRRK